MSWKPQALVLGPGGVKGLKVLGFLTALEDANFLSEVTTFCGVSVGAMISLLLISGYTIREVITNAVLLDFFSEIENFSLDSSLERMGLISSEPFKKVLSDLVFSKFHVIPTLKGLQTFTGKTLVTTTLNVTDEEPLMLNPVEHPEVSCVDAVMFSLNIPFVFYQLKYEDKICVDGALANPYPVDYLDNRETRVLGVYLKTASSPEVNSTMSYYQKMLNSVMEQRRRSIIQHSSDKCVHVCLEVGVSSTFKMSIQEKADIIVEGLKQGQDFLKAQEEGSYEFVSSSKQTLPSIVLQ